MTLLRPARLTLLALAAVVLGATIAAHPAPPDEACFYLPDGSSGTYDLQKWPFGTACVLDSGERVTIHVPSVAETLLVTAAVAALLALAAARWREPWAGPLASSLALLGLAGWLAHALGYPGFPVFVGALAWPLAYAIQRDWLASFVVCACVLPTWLLFDVLQWPWIGIPLAVAAAVLVTPRISAAAAGPAGTPVPPR